MSASTDIQRAITELLPQSGEHVLGDGAATVFAIDHGFGMQALPSVRVRRTSDGSEMAEETDYTLGLTDQNTVTITATGAAPGAGAWTATVARLRLRAVVLDSPAVLLAPENQNVPLIVIIPRRPKDRANDILNSLGKHRLCLQVVPPLPQRAEVGGPDIFFSEAEVRVRIIETPATNLTGVDAWDLMDDVMAALHWQWPAILADPLKLARKPAEIGTAQGADGTVFRDIDVIFTATYGFRPPLTT